MKGNSMNYRIKKKPWILRLFTKPFQTVAFSPNIYTPDGKEISKAQLEHEICHLRQQRDTGRLRYLFKYLTSKKFQFDMEVEAIAVEIEYSDQSKRQAIADSYARLLSSSAYSHCAPSYEVAMRAICKACGGGLGEAI